MQSQPHLTTPIQSEQSTYLLGVHGMRDMKGFSSTAYIVKQEDNESANHATLTTTMQQARQRQPSELSSAMKPVNEQSALLE